MTTIIAKTSNETSRYPTVSAGVHDARCIKIIELGTQRKEYKGDVSYKRQVLIIWEVPEEKDGNGQPLTISKFYTLSLHEKSALAQDLASWRGRPFSETEKQSFDIAKLAGVPCKMNVMMSDTGKAKISSIMPLGKNDKIAEQINSTLVFSMDEYLQGKKENFNQLSEGIRKMILNSKELEDMNQDLGDENNGSDLKVGDTVPF